MSSFLCYVYPQAIQEHCKRREFFFDVRDRINETSSTTIEIESFSNFQTKLFLVTFI